MSLDHVSVTTSDLERSIAFYRDAVGLELLDRGETAEPGLSTLTGLEDVRLRWAELDLGNAQRLELVQYLTAGGDPLDPSPNRPGATHLALAVDDIGPVQARLADARALISGDVVTLTEEGDWHGARILYARDPDGVTIELVQRERVVVLPDADREPATRDR